MPAASLATTVTLPFTHEMFLDVFGRYNASLWPAAVALWMVTAGVILHWLRTRRLAGRVMFALLALHWGWSAVAYHWLFFRSINPAATAFAVMFGLQAALFAWLAVAGRGAALSGWCVRGFAGAGLVLYGLVYPLVGLALGLEYPRLPLFGVPCPTALITAGLLITAVDVPRFVNPLPLAWTVVGSSAAFALDIRADLALVAAAVLLALDSAVPSALGRKTESLSP
jgi:hypothetical protein